VLGSNQGRLFVRSKYADEFEFGLDLILDALEKVRGVA
jgi:hypothetical protein